MSGTLEEYLDCPYSLVITPDEEGRYGVVIMELPGCVTYAEHWEDIPQLAREAMTSWIGSAVKHNEPVPVPSTVSV